MNIISSFLNTFLFTLMLALSLTLLLQSTKPLKSLGFMSLLYTLLSMPSIFYSILFGFQLTRKDTALSMISMITYLIALVLLVGGYFLYGKQSKSKIVPTIGIALVLYGISQYLSIGILFTLSYAMLAVLFYFEVRPVSFKPHSILEMSIVALVMGLFHGVLYRELTKFLNYQESTSLGKLHVHILTLGFLTLFILYFATKFLNSTTSFKKIVRYVSYYALGLMITVSAMLYRGVSEVYSITLSKGMDKAISGIAGIGHILLSVSLVLVMLQFLKESKNVQ